MRRLKQIQPAEVAHKLEGIRFSLLGAIRAFERVEQRCRALEDNDGKSLELESCLHLVNDCWSVIDGANRAL